MLSFPTNNNHVLYHNFPVDFSHALIIAKLEKMHKKKKKKNVEPLCLFDKNLDLFNYVRNRTTHLKFY
jgi:hypothetical protein